MRITDHWEERTREKELERKERERRGRSITNEKGEGTSLQVTKCAPNCFKLLSFLMMVGWEEERRTLSQHQMVEGRTVLQEPRYRKWIQEEQMNKLWDGMNFILSNSLSEQKRMFGKKNSWEGI